jgi:hypothetical protein
MERRVGVAAGAAFGASAAGPGGLIIGALLGGLASSIMAKKKAARKARKVFPEALVDLKEAALNEDGSERSEAEAADPLPASQDSQEHTSHQQEVRLTEPEEEEVLPAAGAPSEPLFTIIDSVLLEVATTSNLDAAEVEEVASKVPACLAERLKGGNDPEVLARHVICSVVNNFVREVEGEMEQQRNRETERIVKEMVLTPDEEWWLNALLHDSFPDLLTSMRHSKEPVAFVRLVLEGLVKTLRAGEH